MTQLSSFNQFGSKNDQFSQFILRFRRDQTCFGISDIFNIEITVYEAHKEYNSLIDQIRAKYELLDSGEGEVVGTPAFNAEYSKLAHLLACIGELCSHLNLSMSKELHRSLQFMHWRVLNSKFVCDRFSRVWRMQLS